MYKLDQATGNSGRDKTDIETDKYSLYYDRHLFQVVGVLDLLSGPASNWMIYQEQAARVFKLARAAMDQWLKDVRELELKYTDEEQMKEMDIDPYENMGNPVIWAGVLCHKVIREGDVWDQFYSSVRKDDWTMRAVHCHCKKNKHHRFWDVRRDGVKTYHTLRLRSMGKRKDRRAKAEKISKLLEAAGYGPLSNDVMNMAVLEDAQRPPGGLTVACADELWRRWKDRRNSEHADRVRHAQIHRQAEQAAAKASNERTMRMRAQRLEQLQEGDSDFTDEEDDYDVHADPATRPPTGEKAGCSERDGAPSAQVQAMHREESDDHRLGLPGAHDQESETAETATTPFYDEEDGDEDVVSIKNGIIDPEKMHEEQDRITMKRKGLVLLNPRRPIASGTFDVPSDDEYDFGEADDEDMRDRALMGGGFS